MNSNLANAMVLAKQIAEIMAAADRIADQLVIELIDYTDSMDSEYGQSGDDLDALYDCAVFFKSELEDVDFVSITSCANEFITAAEGI